MEWKQLWVGNLGSDVNESDLVEVFSQYGAVESVSAYSSRSYAFVFFRRPQDAAAAKVALSGFVLRGSPLKIEFARPAKPSTHLWVGGISPALSKDHLEREFLHFGNIIDLKFLRDRNTAFIEFALLGDASRAAASMNGRRLAGHPIRVDFLRSQPREQWPDSDKAQPQPLPSKVLWIDYPQNFHIDEQMLHNAMILFGEIDTIKSFPLRNYSLVKFRSVDEARRAKEGLQGRLFNDSRITIMYSPTMEMQNNNFGGGSGILGPHNMNWTRPSLPALSPDQFQMDTKRPRIDHASAYRSRDAFFSEPFPNVEMKPPLQPNSDFIWRGIIAKGGTAICSARCVPIGKWAGSDLPQVVNCSARTGLDMLTKHYAEAIGFETVFFLPDSEDDFASYTEFLRYLGAKNRAGVAKFDDGTTLFLVPPSEFLTKVLKVAGPERLYGVVLKFPQLSGAFSEHHSHLPITSQYPDRPVDYGRPFPEEPRIPPETSSGPQEYAYSNLGPVIALTPELTTTLSSRLPPNAQTANPSPSPSHGWRQDYHQIPDHGSHHISQPQSYLPLPQQGIGTGSGFSAGQYQGGFYNTPPPQQPHMNPVTQSTETSNQAQKLPGTSEVDKDQRYQSTLQFAANLLLQIQHQVPGHKQ